MKYFVFVVLLVVGIYEPVRARTQKDQRHTVPVTTAPSSTTPPSTTPPPAVTNTTTLPTTASDALPPYLYCTVDCSYDRQYIASPVDCSKYLQCRTNSTNSSGYTVTHYRCQDGKVYNAANNACCTLELGQSPAAPRCTATYSSCGSATTSLAPVTSGSAPVTSPPATTTPQPTV